MFRSLYSSSSFLYNFRIGHMAKSCSLFYSWDMNIHDVVEPRDIFFQQHWEEYYFCRKRTQKWSPGFIKDQHGSFTSSAIHCLVLRSRPFWFNMAVVCELTKWAWFCHMTCLHPEYAWHIAEWLLVPCRYHPPSVLALLWFIIKFTGHK